MSMNLICEEMEIPQTPTYITWMILSNNDGGLEGIKYRYIQWANYQRQELFNNAKTKKDQKDIDRAWKAHIKKLNSFKELHWSYT